MAQAPNPNPTLTENEGNQIETGLSDTFSKTLALYNGYELFRITKFYRDRIEQAIEEDVETVISVLTRNEYFSQEEYQKLTELTHSGHRRRSSKLLLNLVLGKGSRVQRVMWESFEEMKHTLPKLNKIMIDIQEKGDSLVNEVMIDKHVADVPSALKDAQRQHKEKLQKQSEKLEVKTILIKEKVKIFKLIDRYTELTIISDVRHRELVEHELLARGRDHEEWRQKQLRRELEKIRTDKLFHSSFSRGGIFSRMKKFYKRSDSGSFTGTSAVIADVIG
eukprot:gi/632990270/ref/XP_007884091.1/ PREDICTED: uncharacterized protein LOC103173240 [Callorhinchus milii]